MPELPKDSEFLENARKAREEVESWPEWKRNVIGAFISKQHQADPAKPAAPTTDELLKIITTLYDALSEAKAHLDYCGYGDSWERECARTQNIEGHINEALEAAKPYANIAEASSACLWTFASIPGNPTQLKWTTSCGHSETVATQKLLKRSKCIFCGKPFTTDASRK